MTLRVLIVDDEPVARRRLRRLLRGIPDVEVAGEYGDGPSAVDALRTVAADVLLLDIQMPGMDGFDVLRRAATARLPAVIFVTAFDRYAIRAFDVHALDYLLKPVDAKRLAEAIARARTRLAEQRGRAVDDRVLALLNELSGSRRFLTRIPIKSGGKLIVVDLDDVDWIGAADNYVVLHAGAEEHVARDTLGRLERELDPERFVRIHRSTIVRLDRVKELLPDFHGDFVVVLRDGTRLTLSRTYRAKLEQLLGREL